MKPFPRTETVVKRMNIDSRTIQRSINRLEKIGLIKKQKIKGEFGGQTVMDLSSLVTVLSKYAVNEPGYRERLKKIIGAGR